MALSDQLRKLADRAEEAEERAPATRDKARADVERDLETCRETAQARAEQLRETTDANKDKIPAWWNEVQRNWNEHVAAGKHWPSAPIPRAREGAARGGRHR